MISLSNQFWIVGMFAGHFRALISLTVKGSVSGGHWNIPSSTCSNAFMFRLALEKRGSSGGWRNGVVNACVNWWPASDRPNWWRLPIWYCHLNSWVFHPCFGGLCKLCPPFSPSGVPIIHCQILETSSAHPSLGGICWGVCQMFECSTGLAGTLHIASCIWSSCWFAMASLEAADSFAFRWRWGFPGGWLGYDELSQFIKFWVNFVVSKLKNGDLLG